VALAQEVVHSFKSSKKKHGSVGFKLDFHKAYDILEWNFILAVLRNLGFDQRFITLIYQCISTVSFTLLLNGSRSVKITPERGIRQGDPLSPYLFILCNKVLARMLNREVDRGTVKGVKLVVGAPSISKLLYFDDVLLFCGAKIAEVEVLMNYVDKFCSWSSQSLSKDKSGIFVSKGVHVQFTRQVKHMWGIKQLASNVKYLGVPLFLSHNKTRDFSFVKEKLESQINGWKCKSLKSLSWSGRATLIKYVALATPIYNMSTFKLPKGLNDSIDSLVQKFWWNPRNDGIKFATPKAWVDLCKPLSEGGLSFQAFESFNEVMIAKLAWWVLSRRDSFCVQVLRAKYKVGCNWLLKNPSKNASFVWRGIEGARSLLAQGACRLVGSGNDIVVWRDPWIPDLPNFIPPPIIPTKICSAL
jgi:hypothetical protein